jgi:hypothetical protein
MTISESIDITLSTIFQQFGGDNNIPVTEELGTALDAPAWARTVWNKVSENTNEIGVKASGEFRGLIQAQFFVTKETTDTRLAVRLRDTFEDLFLFKEINGIQFMNSTTTSPSIQSPDTLWIQKNLNIEFQLATDKG